jgi:aminoglycoside 3-N-acetyltransferase
MASVVLKRSRAPVAEATLRELVDGLRAMGVVPGDVLIVHSSMKSLGPVRGGPATLVAALQRAVGRRGTILMPAFSYCFEHIYEPTAAFDREQTPTKVGLVSETFRRSPGVLRSRHPTHSVAVWGRLAEELTAGHGPGGDGPPMAPFERAARRGAKVLLIGCQFRALSLLHAAEELAQVPWLEIPNWGHRGWRPTALTKDDRGRTVRVTFRHIPGCSAGFPRAQQLAEQRGLIHKARLAAADVLWFEAQPLVDLVVDELRRRPDFLLCAPGTCRACDDRRAVFDHSTPGGAAVSRFMVDVVTRCGCRLAGSKGEEQAAALIAQQMEEIGLANVQTLRFPIHTWQQGFSSLEAQVNSQWQRTTTAPVTLSPSTGGRTLEGPVVHLESVAELDKIRDRRGAIAALWAGYGQSRDEFRRLMQAGFQALILIDRRFTHDDVVAEGVPAQWVPDFTTPTVSLPQARAVEWFGRGPVRCRVKIGGRAVPGESTVVSGEIAGRSPDTILLCGHHDTTFNSTAPDDNLSGVAVTLHAAALLRARGLRPRRTIRFCSFGTEEQLSEGSRWYALESDAADRVRFVINTDSVGARCGTTEVYVTGDDRLLDWFRSQSPRSALQFAPKQDIIPFSDQFPFNCRGVPSLWFCRLTIAAGRHFHHTVRDTLSEIAFDRLAALAEFQADLVETLATAARFPFAATLSTRLQQDVAAMRKKWME